MRQSWRKFLIILTFLSFPITMNYLSPYIIVDGAIQGTVSGSFLVFIGLFLSALILGRGFCGWVCPAAGYQECLGIVNNRPVSSKVNWIKFLIWTPWILLIAAMFILAGGIFKIDPFLLTDYGISVSEPLRYIIYYGVLFLVTVISISLGRRGFCHSACWMAPFMIFGRTLRNAIKTPALHLSADATLCTSCKTCNSVCQMSLDVNSMVMGTTMENKECILCGACVDNCPQKVISYKWG